MRKVGWVVVAERSQNKNEGLGHSSAYGEKFHHAGNFSSLVGEMYFLLQKCKIQFGEKFGKNILCGDKMTNMRFGSWLRVLNISHIFMFRSFLYFLKILFD